MNKTLRYSLVCLLTLICGFTYADEVTFDWSSVTTTSSPKEDVVYTQSPITLTFSKGSGTNIPAENKEGSIRMYNKTEVNIKAADGDVIKHIEFTATGSTYGADKLTFNGVALSNSWDATAVTNEMTLTATNACRFKKIVVTYGKSDGKIKEAAGLSFSSSTINVEKGSDFTPPTFSKSTTAAVTFASDNEDVATVNSDGTISLGGSIGKAVITAKSEENDDYQAGSATCTINVFSYYKYKKATTVTSGKKYIIVAINGDTKKVMYPLSSSKSYGDPSAGNVTINDDVISLSTLYDDDFYVEEAEGGYTMKDPYGRYMYRKGTYTNFNVHATPSDAYVWTIEPQSDGTFKIALDGYYIQYTTKFNCFSEAQENGVMPCLFELTGTTTGITTINSDKVNDGKKYNLNGQRVSDDFKGVYIMNGKKYLSK